MNELVLNEEKIENMIYEIRGRQVMLDNDLARLYRCKNGAKEINQAVKNNNEKFPKRFAFRITEEEYNCLKSIPLTSNKRGGSRKGHTAFTEQGVAMLATILKGDTATKISIAIMDAFVLMRKYISSNLLEQKYINNQVMKNTEDIKILQDSFAKFEEKRKVNEIYFDGQIYDAYSKLTDIMKMAKKELIIIDSYADKSVLDMVSNINVPVKLITKTKGLLSNVDITKYKSQYKNLEVIYNDTFHDRYIILDKEIIYHCGASINHAGNKAFSINLLEDKVVKDSLLSKI